MNKKVLVLMGSDSDLPVVNKAIDILNKFSITVEKHVSSAHRSPEKTFKLVTEAKDNGFSLIICAAGKAAHLAGVSAAHTTLPVLGIPMETKLSGGLDSLLSTVQMPSGTPVATFGTGNAGAVNSGLFAVQIISLSDEKLAEEFSKYKKQLAMEVETKDQAIQ